MPSNENNDTQALPRRSVDNEDPARVTFICRTKRRVDVYWLNFQGQKIKYATLTTGKSVSFNTWITHPWVFRDADTFDVLVANNRDEYYYPEAWNGQEHTQVTIDTPMWTLKEICIQNVRKLISDSDIAQLDIPRDLIRDVLSQEDRAHGYVHFYNPDIN